MFYSKERQKLNSDEQADKKKKTKPVIRGEAKGVTKGFNTSEAPKAKVEILFRKFQFYGGLMQLWLADRL